MELLERVSQTIQGTTSSQIEAQRMNDQTQQSIPSYPHREEPQETRAEHATERVIGREIHPHPSIPQHRHLIRSSPDLLMNMTIPDLTGAGRLMEKKPPKMSMSVPKITGNPKMSGFDMSRMDPLNFTSTPKNRHIDPFAGLSGNVVKTKKLPAGMRPFNKSKKKRGGLW